MAESSFGAESGEQQGDGSEDRGGVAKENTGDGERIEFDAEVTCGEDKAGEASNKESGALEWAEARGASCRRTAMTMPSAMPSSWTKVLHQILDSQVCRAPDTSG